MSAHAIQRFCLVPRERDPGSAGREDAYLSYRFDVICSTERAPSAWDPADVAARDDLVARLARVREGNFQPADVIRLGRHLRKLLQPAGQDDPLSSLGDGQPAPEIELSLEGDDQGALTGLPWEMVPLRPGAADIPSHKVLAATLAALPFRRVLSGQNPNGITAGRLRALLCVVEPGPIEAGDPLAQGAPLQPILVSEFASVLTEAFGPFQMIDVLGPLVPGHALTSENLRAQLRNHQPHLLALVAHGTSGQLPGDPPQVRLRDRWLPVAAIAQELASHRRTGLVLLICCDLARTPNGPAARSAAESCVAAGLAEVVAMQGNIHQPIARNFLARFLADLLVGHCVSRAAVAGRQAVSNHPHAFLPTVFRNDQAGKGPSLLAQSISGYTDQLRGLLDYLPTPPDALARDNLQDRIIRSFDRSGVQALRGPRYSGRTSLLTQALRRRLSTQPAPRPLFYVNCADLPPWPRDVLAGVARVVSKHPALLPEEAAATLQTAPLERARDVINSYKMVLILDHLRIPREGEGRAAWEQFLQSARNMDKSLILTAELSPTLLAGHDDISVHFLSAEECRQYVERFIAPLADRFEEVFAYTGGTLLLLDALRRQAAMGRAVSLDPPGVLTEGAIESVYVRDLLRVLNPVERQALASLCWLPGPTTRDLAAAYLLPPGGEAALRSLIDAGAVHECGHPTQRFIYLPAGKAQALRQWAAEEVAAGAGVIRDTFQEQIADNPEERVAFIYSQPGGPAVLRAAQRAYLKGGDAELARAVADLADSGRGVKDDLLAMFSLLAEQASADSGLLIRAAQLAQALGRQVWAGRWLDRVQEASLGSFDRVRFLHARAAFRKDVGQHAALGPITSDLDEGIRIARAGLEATQDQDKGQWAGQLAALLQNRIATLLFLQSTDLSAVQPDLELLREAGQAPAYANALCTVAEWQMKQAGLGHADWSAIGNRVHEAYVILKNSGEGRYLNYCYYQYAQFLRKRPHPDPGSASALYQQAEEAAADAGEPRRQALAGYRRIELQWGQLKQLNGAEACRQLERLLALLVAEQTDSLTLRAVERLNSLRAAIGLKEATGPVDGYLLEACRAAARLPAASESDRRRLAVSCRAYLAHKLQQGDYPAARELLEELADTLTARLGIVMDDRDPRRVVENLGQRFGT